LVESLGGIQLGSDGLDPAFSGNNQKVTRCNSKGYGLPGGVEGESCARTLAVAARVFSMA
jgi:hypothetical protein